LAEIDPQKVRRYVEMANATGRRNINPEESVDRVLRKLALLRVGRPTWAAVLLFGWEDREFLSTASIHCGRFRGPALVIDDSMLSGPLTDQVDRAMDFIRKNIKVKFVMTGRPARENVWDYHAGPVVPASRLGAPE